MSNNPYNRLFQTSAQARAEHINRAKGRFTELTFEILANNNDDLKEINRKIRSVHQAEGGGCRLYYKRFIENGTSMVCLRVTKNPTEPVKEDNLTVDRVRYSGTAAEISLLIDKDKHDHDERRRQRAVLDDITETQKALQRIVHTLSQ
ncbi:hypothetical protein DFH11DRAFT_1749350 [Phellopilus nigrolimitatus]|nr:hypothetical protein DFH11DRAFT_1749350 [Phellopilus nigrolimitatus]